MTRPLRLDHSIVAVSDWDASIGFYRDVLGAEVVEADPPRVAFRFGHTQLNVHGPGVDLTGNVARLPVAPGNSDLCFVWPGAIEDAVAHLREHGVEVETGPVRRLGARGEGTSVYFRDPDGSLLELIAYPPPGGVPEARLARTDHGLVIESGGWSIVNAAEARWTTDPAFGTWCAFESDDAPAADFGFGIHVLQPGQPNGLYHAEAGQESFMVLAGECLCVIEGEERRLRTWDVVSCPAGTRHIFVGAGDGPCAILMAGTRGTAIHYPVDETAARHGASAAAPTASPREAYAPYPRRHTPTRAPWPLAPDHAE